jgi:hypothetical protein
MKCFMFVAVAAIALGVGGWSQTSMSPALQNAPARKSLPEEYAGSWIAVVQGHTWLTIRLAQTGDQLTGTIQRAQNVQLNDQGDVASVSGEKWSGSFEIVQVDGDGLWLTVTDPGTQESERYLMRLTHDSVAEVQMVAPEPPAMPQAKPWKMLKVGPTAVTPAR